MRRSIGPALAATLLLAISTSVGMRSWAAGASKNRALVLGGGGPVGEAWEYGIIAGLAQKGVDLSHNDLIIGTSAGSVVGARLAIGRPADLMKPEALAPPEGPPPPRASTPASAPPPPDLSMLTRKFQEMASGKRPLEQIRAEIGAWALKAHPVVTEDQFVASFVRRFPEKEWPRRSFECTAIDATNGSLRVWNKDSGVALARAVASSCAFPGVFAPVAIDGHRYMDGGIRSVTNADLAKGYATIVVVAPTLGQTDEIGLRYSTLLDNEVKTLRDNGSKVAVIAPDAASLKAFGPTLTDSSRRIAAAEAGLMQGRAAADKIRPAWQDRSKD